MKMLQQTLPLSFLISSLIFSTLSVSTADSNVYVQCSQLHFTATTQYESNVNSLFASLINSASLYNFNKFQTSSPNDGVYGLFQCRGDVTSPNCKDCVANAVSQLQTTCPMSTGGQIQLEGCFVKYDNTPFFGAQEKTEVSKSCGPSIGYNLDVLNRIDDALAILVGGNGQYFREGDFGSIQGVAQCLQDLSLSDCQDCLLEASGRLRSECETSTWGNMYLGKCYILYVDQGDKSLPNNGTPGSNNGPPSSPDDKKKDKKKKRKKKAIRKLSTSWKWIGGTFTVVTLISSGWGFKYIRDARKRVKDLQKVGEDIQKRVISTEKVIDNVKKEIEKPKGSTPIKVPIYKDCDHKYPYHRYQPYNTCDNTCVRAYSDDNACHFM